MEKKITITLTEVSIHATLAGGDSRTLRNHLSNFMFLSTPPSRVATDSSPAAPSRDSTFLSTPPSRVATRLFLRPAPGHRRFYPRHPRGWRQNEINGCQRSRRFLSTPPSRVATRRTHAGHYPGREVSIHATLAGGDIARKAGHKRCCKRRFYPRHPRGWRLGMAGRAGGTIMFLSTPPSRVATRCGSCRSS